MVYGQKEQKFGTRQKHDLSLKEGIPMKNKEERYSRVPRLSDTRYSKGNGDMQAAKRD